MALQSDGKIILAGSGVPVAFSDYGTARFNTNGSLDTTFNSTGIVTTNLGGTLEDILAVIVQPDGKIVGAGRTMNATWDIGLVRYHSNGSLDTTFNTTGIVETTVGASIDQAAGIVLQPDGKLVTVGGCTMATVDICLVRYHSNGSLDTTFNATGRVTTTIGAGSDYAQSILLQPDGKLVVGGASHNGANDDFALVRYHTDGSLDTTFNGTGKVTTAIGAAGDIIYAMALRADGKIIAAGSSHNGANEDFALAQYNTDGSIDTTFGTAGKVTTPVGTGNDFSYSIALQSDGKIIVAGTAGNALNDFAVVRYTSSGALDPTFNDTGIIVKDLGGIDIAKCVAVQSDGRIVVGGYGEVAGLPTLVLLRYRNY
jgi:uncharacterized delta-60 repeat protein